MKVESFRIEESKVNKGFFVLIAKTEDGMEWVCNGDHWNLTYLIQIEKAFDMNPESGEKK